MRVYLIRLIAVIIVTLTSSYGLSSYSQTLPDFHQLGVESFDEGGVYAASYLLYSDYLKSPDSFKDLELTAYLLAAIDEYKLAEGLLHRIDQHVDIMSYNDSLSYYYYYSRAKVEYNNNQYISSLKSLSQIPLNYELSEIKAFCFEEIGLFDNALQVFKSIYSTENQNRVNCLIGNCYRLMGKYQEAIEHYSKAINNKPDWAFPYYGAGWSYELAGDDKNALKYYNDGLMKDQSYAYLFLMRGEMYHKLGQDELANEDFNTVLRLDKMLEDGTCRQYALFFLGRNDDAMTWMNRLIDLQPNDPGNYYDKACLCCRMGLDGEAIKAMEIAFEKGYRKFAHLDADDDIDPIKNNPTYRALYDKYHAIYQSELEQLKDIL